MASAPAPDNALDSAGKIGPPVEVRLVMAVDEAGLVAVDDRIPWEFKASGLMDAVAAETAEHTVVMGRRSAVMVGGRPRGDRVVVLTGTPGLYRYSRARKCYVDQPIAGIWKGAQIAHSIGEVLVRCGDAKLIYVIGGRATFEAFLPHASVLCRFVLARTILFDASRCAHLPVPHGATLSHVGPTIVGRSGFEYKREVWTLGQALPLPMPAHPLPCTITQRQQQRPLDVDASAQITNDVYGLHVRRPPTASVVVHNARYVTSPTSSRSASVCPADQESALAVALATSLAEADKEEAALIHMALMQSEYQRRLGALCAEDDPLTHPAAPVAKAHTLRRTHTDDHGDDDGDGHGDDDEWCLSADESNELYSDDESDADDAVDQDDDAGSTDDRVRNMGSADVDYAGERCDREVRRAEDGAIGSSVVPTATYGTSVSPKRDAQPEPPLGSCPLGRLGAHSRDLVRRIVRYLCVRDAVAMASTSKWSMASVADLIVGSHTNTTPLAWDVARLVIAIAVYTASTDASPVAQRNALALCIRVPIDQDLARNGLLATEPGPAPLERISRLWCTLWTALARAASHKRADIAVWCASLAEALEASVRQYARAAAVAPQRYGTDLGVRLRDALARPTRPESTSADIAVELARVSLVPLRVARVASDHACAALVDVALDMALRCVHAGVDIVRDDRIVMRMLGPDADDRGARASAASYVVHDVLCGLIDAVATPYGRRNLTNMHDTFDRIESQTLGTVLPGLWESDAFGVHSAACSTSDPAYRAYALSAFGRVCEKLLRASRDRAAAASGLAVRAARLLGLIVAACARRPHYARWLGHGWRMLCVPPAQQSSDAFWFGLADGAIDHAACDTYNTNAVAKSCGRHTPSVPQLFTDTAATLHIPAESTSIIDRLALSDPALGARVLGHLDAPSIGALAQCSRIALRLALCMIMPTSDGCRALVPGMYSSASIPQRQGLRQEETTVVLVPDTDIQVAAAIRVAAYSWWRLPRVETTLAQLGGMLKSPCTPYIMDIPRHMRAQTIADLRERFHRMVACVATIIADATEDSCGAAVASALALTERMAACAHHGSLLDDLAVPEYLRSGSGPACTSIYDAIVASQKVCGQAEAMPIAWYPAIAVTHLAGCRRDVRLLRLACAMAGRVCDTLATHESMASCNGHRVFFVVRALMLRAVARGLDAVDHAPAHSDRVGDFLINVDACLVDGASSLVAVAPLCDCKAQLISDCRAASVRIAISCARGGALDDASIDLARRLASISH
nr:hypothetical protein [Pandoravirus massiliensis]